MDTTVPPAAAARPSILKQPQDADAAQREVITEEIDAFSRLKILTGCPQGQKAATVL
jgi:hypothetical protein